MSSLFSTLRSSTSALDAITEAISITQNNVMNAGSAGYARQTVNLQALRFNPATGYGGGVTNGSLQSARDVYVERTVRIQNGRAAAAETSVISLTKLESALPISAGAAIPSALDKLYRAFSAWAVAPDDLASKQNVAAAAEQVSGSFRNTAQMLSDIAADNSAEIQSVVERVNRLAGRIQKFNAEVRTGAMPDAGVEAGIHATLDELGGDIHVEVNVQEDGTYTLLLDGETPLVIGDKQYELQVSSDAVQNHRGGRLGALLDFRDGALSDQRQELDRLADKIATRLDEFFTGSTAHTLTLEPSLNPASLSAADPGPPPVANGKALQLAALAKPTDANDKLDGRSFTEFYGQLASNTGGKLSEARFEEKSQAQLSAQAVSFREQVSGVSLDEEAVQLLQFQRAYQASARMVAAIDELMEIAVNLGRA
jgi:flagellar hook-associated protein 1 FlgK